MNTASGVIMKTVVVFVVTVLAFGQTKKMDVDFDLETYLEKNSRKDCSKDGKTYAYGEEWTKGHLRYKCDQWGMYTITGCATGKGRVMDKGESHVEGNIVRSCVSKGNSVGYKEAVCGMWGAPSCSESLEKMKKEQKQNSADDMKKNSANPKSSMSSIKYEPKSGANPNHFNVPVYTVMKMADGPMRKVVRHRQ